MYQDDICQIISQSDHPFKSYDRKSKSSIYAYHWMRHIRFGTKTLAAFDTESDTAHGCCHST